MLGTWTKGDSIILKKNPNYNGIYPAKTDTVVIKWNSQSAARLLELQAGTADAIDNVDPQAYATVQNDPNLKLYPRAALNIMYLGFQNTIKPFDNEKVRQAIAEGIDRQRIIDNFYPKGSSVADYFTPCPILGGCEGDPWYKFDPGGSQEASRRRGLPQWLRRDPVLPFRVPVLTCAARPGGAGYPGPAQGEPEHQCQAQRDGIDGFPRCRAEGALPLVILGWGADYPDQTDFLDYHFGKTATPQFGNTFPDIVSVLARRT